MCIYDYKNEYCGLIMLAYPILLRVCYLIIASTGIALADNFKSFEDENEDFMTVINQLKIENKQTNAELEKTADEAQNFVDHVTKITDYQYKVIKEFAHDTDIITEISSYEKIEDCFPGPLQNEEEKRIPILFEYYAKDCIGKKVHHIYELKQYIKDLIEMARVGNEDEKQLSEENLSAFNRFEVIKYLAEMVQLKKTTIHWVGNLMLMWKNDWTIALDMVDLDWSESATNDGPAVACINQVLEDPIMKSHLEDYCDQ